MRPNSKGQFANSHVSLAYDQLYCLNSEGIERDKLYRKVDGWVEEQGKVSWLRGCWGKERKWGERLKEERGSRKLCGKSADPRLGHVILISQRKKEKKTRVSGRQNKKKSNQFSGFNPRERVRCNVIMVVWWMQQRSGVIFGKNLNTLLGWLNACVCPLASTLEFNLRWKLPVAALCCFDLF